jgi:hypothetical protein
MRTLLLATVIAALPAVAHAEFMAKPKSDVRPPSVKIAATPLTVDHLLEKIQVKYMPRMRRCYERGLAQDPTLAGKVTVMFTVDAYGRVRGAATGVTSKVDACLTSALGSWRFPTPIARKPATFRLSLSLQQ